MVLGAALGDRLNELSDRQIGQLLFDFCWPELYVDGPELVIVTQAIDRLRRSMEGPGKNEEAQGKLKQRPVCPKCGNEMFLHCGIDEPDSWLCDYLGCQLKTYVWEADVRQNHPRHGAKDGANLGLRLSQLLISPDKPLSASAEQQPPPR